MLVNCADCHLDYDDTFRNTNCPHRTFEMHCGVFVNGQRGCAHTIAELEESADGAGAPNVNCPMNQLVEAFSNDRPLSSLVESE